MASGIFQSWLQLTNKLQAGVSGAVGNVGYQSAKRPWTAIFSCLFVALCCGLGFLSFRIESSGDKLWTEQVSPSYQIKDYVDAKWGSDAFIMSVLIQAKEKGQNALTVAAFKEAFDLQDEIYAVEDTNGNTLRDLCLRDGLGNCRGRGALRFFSSNRTVFEMQVQDNASLLLRAISNMTYADSGLSVSRDEVFGQFETSGTLITSAAVWRLAFVVDASKDVDVVQEWEKNVLDLLVKDDSSGIKQKWQHIHVEAWSSGRSLDDELARSVSGDITFMVISYNFLVVACALMLGHPCRGVEGRRMLGGCDFFLVIFAVIAGYGLSCAFQIPFTSLQQILPFILVGIGVDDAFVIVSAFDRADRSKPVEERIRDAMMNEGMSVTLTSLTDIVAFLAGSTAAFPAVRYFCIYAGLSLIFIYTFHLTAFCALLALDERRILAGRFDVLCCVKSKKKPRTCEQKEEEESAATRMMGKYTEAITSSLAVKLGIFFVFLAFCGICLWQAIEETDTNFNIMDLAPDDSYMRDFLETEIKYWDADTTGMNLQIELFFNELDWRDPSVQSKIRKAEVGLLAVSCIDKDYGVSSWHKSFTAWARGNPEFNASDFVRVEGVDFLTGANFYPALRRWLEDCDLGCYFNSDVKISDDRLWRSRVRARQITLKNSDKQGECLTEIEDFNEKISESLPETFAYNSVHIFYHQYRMIRQELFWTTGMCFIAVLVISLAIISHPVAVLIVFGVILLVFIDLLGCIPIAGVSLNSISMINLVMAIGLVVDYSMHIAHSYMSQDPTLSRNKRTVLAMKQIGLPVAKGILSTFIAILPLAFASSNVFRVFFKLFLAILIVGGTHGLVFMPVVLSLCGPTAIWHTHTQTRVEVIVHDIAKGSP